MECQYQFQYERWNCSPVTADDDVDDVDAADTNDEDATQNNVTSPVDTLIQRGILAFNMSLHIKQLFSLM